MQAQQGAPLLTSHNVNKGEDDGRNTFQKVSQPDFSISTKRNKMENSTTSCAAGDRFALSSLPGHNLQNPYLGVGPKIIITCHITKMIKTLPNIQHCDHLQSHLFQPSLHWPPCKQGRSWQVWKWRYDVLIIVIMIKGCPHHCNFDQRMIRWSFDVLIMSRMVITRIIFFLVLG